MVTAHSSYVQRYKLTCFLVDRFTLIKLTDFLEVKKHKLSTCGLTLFSQNHGPQFVFPCHTMRALSYHRRSVGLHLILIKVYLTTTIV